MKVAIGSEPDQSKDFAMIIAMTSFESRIIHSTVLRRSSDSANGRYIFENTQTKHQ